jgi:5-methylcytosine-specific restriction protein A
MPWSAPKHCSHGHPPFTGPRCPACSAAFNARTEARRGTATQRGYDSKWRTARNAYLASHPLCAACGLTGVVEAATVVDHIVPHKGDQTAFWDRANWQPLCKRHHDQKTSNKDGGFGRKYRQGG